MTASVWARPGNSDLVGAGGEGDAAVEQGVEERGRRRCSSVRAGAVVVDGGSSSPKYRPTSGPTTRHPHRGSPALGDTPVSQPPAPARLGERRVGVVVEQLEHGEPGGGGERVPRQRARLVHGPVRREHGHHVGPAAERRRAAGRRRSPCRSTYRSGRDAEPLLGAAAAEAEAGDHLVEDQQRAGRVARGPQALEEARRPAATRPMLAATGSTMTQATSSSSRRHDVVRARPRCRRPPARARRPSRAAPSVATPLPPAASRASPWPW